MSMVRGGDGDIAPARWRQSPFPLPHPAGLPGANPVDGLATGILGADHRLRPVAVAKTRHPDPLDLLERQVRHIDVEDLIGRQRMHHQPRTSWAA